MCASCPRIESRTGIRSDSTSRQFIANTAAAPVGKKHADRHQERIRQRPGFSRYPAEHERQPGENFSRPHNKYINRGQANKKHASRKRNDQQQLPNATTEDDEVVIVVYSQPSTDGVRATL